MYKRLLTLLAVWSFSHAAWSLEPEEIREVLANKLPNLQIVRIREGTISGMYEVDLAGTQTVMVSRDGKYVIAGDIYDLSAADGMVNLSEQRREERKNELNDFRRETLDKYDESKMVVFSPDEENVKATITVFTDTTCGYCRKLHQDVPELNRMGIAIRYLAYPRGGTGSRAYDQMVSAWCAEDPAKALTLAKLGKEIDAKTCANPVAEEYAMGQQFGVDATPALVLDDGSLVLGYRGAEHMASLVGVEEES